MAGEDKTTTDHDVIRQWAEARGGKPVTIAGTGSDGKAGVLRIHFDDERLEPISWDEFFEKFEESGLAFLYQDEMADGRESRFFKFIQRPGS